MQMPVLFRAVIDGPDEETQEKEKPAIVHNMSVARLYALLASLPPNVLTVYTFRIGK